MPQRIQQRILTVITHIWRDAFHVGPDDLKVIYRHNTLEINVYQEHTPLPILVYVIKLNY